MKTPPNYGTVDWYASMFEDILADAAIHEKSEDSIVEGQKILAGFKIAIQNWLNYHQASVASYEYLLEEFIESTNNAFDKQADLAREEASLPSIPTFPTLK